MSKENPSNSEWDIRYLILNENQDKTGEYHRVKKGVKIEFVLSPFLSTKKVRLFTNCPLKDQNEFNRENYSELSWIYPSTLKYDDTDRFAQIQCGKSGTFHYFFTIDRTNEKSHSNGEGYFQVEPELIDSNGKSFDQSSIICQSVLSKCLGDMSQWESRLQVAFHSGFNFIHLTPIQQLYTVSNSSYSISNHHELNPKFNGSFQQLKEILIRLKREFNLHFITDLVYNHAANDCQLLKDHPESSYNLINSPHLKPAVLLDSILMQFTKDVQQGKLIDKGIPSDIREHHLQLIRHYFLDEILPSYRFWEFYIVDLDRIVEEFRQYLGKKAECPRQSSWNKIDQLQLDHGEYRRMLSKVNFDLASEIFFCQHDGIDDRQHSIERTLDLFRHHLQYLNEQVCQRLTNDLIRAIDNCLASCRYHFFAFDGPHFSSISFPSSPFVGNYFHYPNEEFLHPDLINQKIENDSNYQLNVMAHNGWVMDDDPLRCFADEGQFVYLRRDLLQWSDIIKLRFGNSPSDCPALFDYMKEYTRLIASIFDGCRLDNCHSTPLWVAQQMMDYAREINPNFYINAELFTKNLQTDLKFINQIGINSLVRESYRAFDPYELGQICSSCSESDPIGSLIPLKRSPLRSLKPYSLYYDQTHDNPSQIERRSVEDVLPRSSLVLFSNCSVGSNRGYDELIPHHIDVVHEDRLYRTMEEIPVEKTLIEIKKSLHQIHFDLSQQGFHQLLVDQLTSNVIMMTRYNPQTHQTMILISHTSFIRNDENRWEHIPSVSFDGQISSIRHESSLKHFYQDEPIEEFVRCQKTLNGLTNNEIYFREHLAKDQSRFIRLINDGQTIEFTNEFRPGSILILHVDLHSSIRQNLNQIEQYIDEFSSSQSNLQQILRQLKLIDFNRVLYRSSNEEISDGKGFDVYQIPSYGSMVFCGIQGQIVLFDQIRLDNNIKHPLIQNLKQGNWLLDYVSQRLIVHRHTNQLGQWISNLFKYVKDLPRLLVPIYFERILRCLSAKSFEYVYSLMNDFVRQSSTFVHLLSLTSVQLISIVKNARLPSLSPLLRQPRPDEDQDDKTYERVDLIPSLAAGLPHFSEGIWRNWGRDTFISLRGLLLLTGRFDEARYLILSYGQCLRHGLIPNLLSDGKTARYNARDAVWWWIYSISQYCRMLSDGHELLSDKVSRLYPTNSSTYQNVGIHDQCLYDVIQEVLLRHLQCLSYRERGAGYSLDSDMTDEGFNNQIGIDIQTGFVYGGNRWNCGTWMDKMGSSDKAGNKGHPATPRDGSAIELVSLLRSSLAFLIQMNEDKFYPYDSVEIASGSSGKMKLTYRDWLKRLDDNFEKYFWIDQTNQDEFVNRKQIYKDTINSSLRWTDFQFRPNFLIAAVISPEMFDKTHIWSALKQAEEILLGRYGIKTLDPNDYNYVGDYNNDDDSFDYKRARGFNYHNGPEWLWLTGYYIRAKLYWSKKQDDPQQFKQTKKHLKDIFANLFDLIRSNDWKGLPELTNSNGSLCSHSCQVQAWTSATLLEAFYDLNRV